MYIKIIYNEKRLYKLIILLIYICIILYKNEYKRKKYKNYINVSYAFDKNYHYITHVSMKSIMLNQYNDTFINFYLLVSNITDEQKIVINKIKEEHKNCEIHFIDMGNQFKEFNLTNNIWSTANYYRIKLPDILKEIKKIIYLDTDTIIYKDLTKLYNYDIKGKYFIGMLENIGEELYIRNNVSFNNFINTGVLLCNLEELRKDNISFKIIEYIKKNHNKIKYSVNEPTNIITHKKNGYFSPEYVVIGFCNKNDAYKYYQSSKIKVNSTLVARSFENPYILHFIIYFKPWKDIPNKDGLICTDSFTRFYEAARKTSYYYEILKKFPILKKNIKNSQLK